MPLAGVLGQSWPSKFEGQFKLRDESGVNACPVQSDGELSKALFGGAFPRNSSSVYRAAFANG
jgi:hypothetical protein